MPKTIRRTFTLDGPLFDVMLISPGAEAVGRLEHETADGAVLVTVSGPEVTDRLLLNFTGAPVSIGQVMSDGRLAWIRARGDTVVESALAMGRRLMLDGQQLAGP